MPDVIAIDVGYGNTKPVWSHDPDKSGKERWGEACFPSITPMAMVDEESTGGAYNPDRILITVRNKGYYAGPAASMGIEARTLDPDYIESDDHEVLLRAAIHWAMREKRALLPAIDMLVVGLPVSGFSARGKRLRDIALAPRDVPVPRVLQTSGVPAVITVRAKQVKVLPQPFGSLRYAAQNLPDTDELFSDRALSMVIDPGYRTFDWFVANGMRPEMKLSGSFDGGVSNILRQVSQKIGYEHGTGSLEFDQVEEGLLRGAINLGYKVIDTRPYQAVVLDAARKEVMAFLGRIDANKARLRRVFLTGGGASYYKLALAEKLPGYQIQMLDNGLMGNARGFWLSGYDDFDV
ncbi:ParM/StbA family protein [Verminephrobacter eiseniae]|uniref:Uncharacterized protein n=1 Tax=Verminephrobacter eiseniae (strain EF01-2) TaxID=391735 RepID=A1WP26_VEREI|nr:hypothetical protein [Verminephrobacter eiseniae]ABM59383.1 hypothetical protein Veis_3667 [Verminephrobacter eiseniae EF01-2]MCW5302617.1 hypothetical protein [Verminephrobacter eiseniae]MCW8180776.1 hypothetical protein [Verminephrobacter eiseniae]